MRVIYHGSQAHMHGPGVLEYDNHNKWHVIRLDNGGYLYRVRRCSFTILDNDLDNQAIDIQYDKST
jgi:hypothetical protein